MRRTGRAVRPSIRPPQPDGYLAALNYPIRDYSATEGQEQYRRGLYVHWQRTFLHPSLMTFDAPSREECTVNRVGNNYHDQLELSGSGKNLDAGFADGWMPEQVRHDESG